MLTSSRAWAGLRHAHIICMVGVQKQSLAMPEGLHPALESLLQQCLDRRPEARPSFQSITDTLSHFVQTTRGIDPADLLTRPATSGCSCDQGSACCSVCRHSPACHQASCLRCQPSPVSSRDDGTSGMPDAEPVPSQSAQDTYAQDTVSMSAVPELSDSARVDQGKSSHVPSQSGKGVKRTCESL